MSIRKPWMHLFVLVALAVPSFADSQVRIVRLSDVEGNVQMAARFASFPEQSSNFPNYPCGIPARKSRR